MLSDNQYCVNPNGLDSNKEGIVRYRPLRGDVSRIAAIGG